MSRAARPTRRPRVLVVGCEPPLQTFLYRLFDGLRDDFEIVLASRRPFGGRAGAFERLPLPDESWPRVLRASSTLGRGLPALRHPPGRRLRALDGWRRLPYLGRRVDLIYMPWTATAASHLPLLRAGIPSLLSCRGSHVQVAPWDPSRRYLAEALPACFAAATRVHCVSRATLRAAEEHGLDAAKATVIPPAVDPELLTPTEPPPPPPWRLLSVGSLIWLKGFEDALVAVRQLVDAGHDVRYDLVGDGQDRQRLLFTLHDLGLMDRVTLHGHLEPAAVRELLAQAHLFLLPSFSEGISNAALEAMAAGLPVVATKVGGMDEALRDGVDGLLVPPQEPDAMTNACLRLLRDPSLRTRLGESAHRRIRSDFRLDRQVERFAKLCCKTLR